MRPIRAARVSIPPPSLSNPVSDREDDPDDDEDSPELDDSEILADLPDDTDVRRSSSIYQQERVTADPILLMWFIGWPGDRPRPFATEKHIRLGSTTIRTHLKAIVFTSKPHQDVGPRSNEGAGESDRVGHVR